MPLGEVVDIISHEHQVAVDQINNLGARGILHQECRPREWRQAELVTCIVNLRLIEDTKGSRFVDHVLDVEVDALPGMGPFWLRGPALLWLAPIGNTILVVEEGTLKIVPKRYLYRLSFLDYLRRHILHQINVLWGIP